MTTGYVDHYLPYFTAKTGDIKGGKIEFEAKYRSANNFTKRYDNEVLPHQDEFMKHASQNDYERIKFHYRNLFSKVEHTTDEYDKNKIRRTRITSPDTATGANASSAGLPAISNLVYQKKSRINNGPRTDIFKDYEIYLSFQLEEPVNPSAFDEKSIDLRRSKDRISAQINSVSRLDLTFVDEENLNQGVWSAKKRAYEVELEFTPTTAIVNRDELQLFFNTIIEVKKIFNDTNELYTNDERRNLINEIALALKVPIQIWTENNRSVPTSMAEVLRKNLVNLRELKPADMVYGGLVGNQRVIIKDNTRILVGTRYTATWKVDGIRKILIQGAGGYWFVSSSGDSINLIARISGSAQFNIVDGELVPMESRNKGAPNAKYWYIPFDMIVANRSMNIQASKHFDRMVVAKNLIDNIRISGGLIDFSVKGFYELKNVDDFYFQCRAMLERGDMEKISTISPYFKSIINESLNLPYKTDGLVFTPEDVGYLPANTDLDTWEYKAGRGGQKGKKRRQRVLTETPDVVKWKPVINIDFEIRRLINNKIELYTANGKFIGDKITPFDNEVDSKNEMTKDLPSGTIVQYDWEIRDGDGLFVPSKVRNDKTSANQMFTALANWKQIHDAITPATMAGKTFKLMYKYHNRIKKELFNLAGGKTLLDIGSGVGGDVNKWIQAGFKKVVAVEPDPEKIPELERRIKLNEFDDGKSDLAIKQIDVRVVNAGGEETKRINAEVANFIGGKVDVVSIMLSLSFFWKPDNKKQKLNELIDTIKSNLKPGGKIIFLTIDGSSVLRVYDFLAAEGITTLPRLVIYPAILALTREENKLWINIKDTIVKDQTEYLVNLDEFYTLLGYKDQLNKVKSATHEPFLSPNEKIFTQMYSYGIISDDGKGVDIKMDREMQDEINYLDNTTGLASIGLPTDMLSATLMCISDKYRKSDSKARETSVKQLKDELSQTVNISIDESGLPLWEITRALLTSYIKQKARDGASEVYSVAWIRSILSDASKVPSSGLPLEILGIVAVLFDINIIVLQKTSTILNESKIRAAPLLKVLFPAKTNPNKTKKYCVLIRGKNTNIANNWSPIGIVDSKFHARTLFTDNDPIVKDLLINAVVTTDFKDYDKYFIETSAKYFGEAGKIPSAPVAIDPNNQYYWTRLNKFTKSIAELFPRYIKEITNSDNKKIEVRKLK